MNEKKIIIAIDGYSACGKSTLAKSLARYLGYIFIDTGAMYRATTLYFLENKIDWNNEEEVSKALQNINIHFEKKDGKTITILNGKDVEEEIRKMYVSENVSLVAAISKVRRAMVAQQQKMGINKGIVMDGRDIGTVVFPNAELKLFMTADTDVRTQRRLSQISTKEQVANFETVKQNLLERDRIDTTRADSPLVKADDAIVMDNTTITKEEQFELSLSLVTKVIAEANQA